MAAQQVNTGEGKVGVKHCPGCGSHNIDPGPKLGTVNSAQRTFDIYCHSCGWSGDVSPDYALEEGPA